VDGFHPPGEATRLGAKPSPDDQAYFEITRESGIYGTADECLERLVALRRKYRAREMGVVTVTYDQQSRLESYRLLAGG